MPKLLVIDDEPEILEMIRGHFGLRGFQVLTARDGAEGLALLQAENPDVVLLDLKMEQVDGDLFLEMARKNKTESKILVITGFQDENLRKKVEDLGVEDFLEKPVSLRELQKRIERLIEK